MNYYFNIKVVYTNFVMLFTRIFKKVQVDFLEVIIPKNSVKCLIKIIIMT